MRLGNRTKGTIRKGSRRKARNCIDCLIFHSGRMVETETGEYLGRYCSHCAMTVRPEGKACDAFDFVWK